jgi:hypothetical protein
MYGGNRKINAFVNWGSLATPSQTANYYTITNLAIGAITLVGPITGGSSGSSVHTLKAFIGPPVGGVGGTTVAAPPTTATAQ